MERKVIKQGNDTLTITLPREWTKKYNIKAGDSLGIKAKNEILEIRNKEINLKEPIYFDVNFNDEKLLNWTLGALYKIGFEEIHLRYSDTTIFNKIQKLIKNNLGFIITDQEKNMCIIKNMTTDNSDNLSALMHRSFLIALSFAENCCDALKKKKFSHLNNLIYLHDNTDQIIKLCERLIIKTSYADVTNSSFNLAILENLELICDDYKDICKFFGKIHKPSKNHKKIISLLENINKIFEKTETLIFSYNEKEVIKILLEIKENNSRIESLYKEGNCNEIIFLFYLKSISDLIKNFFPTILLVNINQLKDKVRNV